MIVLPSSEMAVLMAGSDAMFVGKEPMFVRPLDVDHRKTLSPSTPVSVLPSGIIQIERMLGFPNQSGNGAKCAPGTGTATPKAKAVAQSTHDFMVESVPMGFERTVV
jgi:hypothetical protein